MSDYGGDYDEYEGFFDDADWLYVEDAYDEADELAEHTCPSPTFPSFIPDVDTDPYEYFIDLDYLSDGYYDDRADQNIRRQGKRKWRNQAKRSHQEARASKRQWIQQKPGVPSRVSASAWDIPNIVYVPQPKRFRDPSSYIPTTKDLKLSTVALLKDWRDRFAGHNGLAMEAVKLADLSDRAPDRVRAKDHLPLRNGATDKISDSPDAREEPSYQNDMEEEENGRDLEGMKDLAFMLSETDKDLLIKMLEEKGIDPAALDMVMEDLIQGKQREFGEDEAGDDEEDIEDSAGEGASGRHANADGATKETGADNLLEAADASQLLPPKRKAGLMDFGIDDTDYHNDQITAAPRARTSKRGKYRAQPRTEPSTKPNTEPSTEPDSVKNANTATGQNGTRGNGAGIKRKADADGGGELHPKRTKAVDAHAQVVMGSSNGTKSSRGTRSLHK